MGLGDSRRSRRCQGPKDRIQTTLVRNLSRSQAECETAITGSVPGGGHECQPRSSDRRCCVLRGQSRPGQGSPASLADPVPIFYALAFGISWGGIVLILGPNGLFSTGTTMPFSGGAALLAGPSIAGVLLTGLVDGRSGFRRLLSQLRRWRVGARWYAAALLTGPLVMGGTVFALSLAAPEFRPDFLTADDKLNIVVTGIVLGLMVGFFEELGWTGFALPGLRRRYGVVTTGLVMGLLWGLWHFPMFAGTRDPTGTLPAALVVASSCSPGCLRTGCSWCGSTTGPRACP